MKPEHTHIYFWKMPFSFRHSSPWQNFSDQEAGWLCSKVKHHISESWSCISQRQCRMELLECHASTAGTLPWLQWPGMAFPAAAGTFSTMHRAACMGWKGKGMFVFGETLQRKLVPRSVSKTNAEVMNLYACLLQKTQLYSPCICHTHTAPGLFLVGRKCPCAVHAQRGRKVREMAELDPLFLRSSRRRGHCNTSIRWQDAGMSSSLCPGWMAHKQGSATAAASKKWR